MREPRRSAPPPGATLAGGRRSGDGRMPEPHAVLRSRNPLPRAAPRARLTVRATPGIPSPAPRRPRASTRRGRRSGDGRTPGPQASSAPGTPSPPPPRPRAARSAPHRAATPCRAAPSPHPYPYPRRDPHPYPRRDPHRHPHPHPHPPREEIRRREDAGASGILRSRNPLPSAVPSARRAIRAAPRRDALPRRAAPAPRSAPAPRPAPAPAIRTRRGRRSGNGRTPGPQASSAPGIPSPPPSRPRAARSATPRLPAPPRAPPRPTAPRRPAPPRRARPARLSAGARRAPTAPDGDSPAARSPRARPWAPDPTGVSPRTIASIVQPRPPSTAIATHSAIFAGVHLLRSSSGGTATGGRFGSVTTSSSTDALMVSPVRGTADSPKAKRMPGVEAVASVRRAVSGVIGAVSGGTPPSQGGHPGGGMAEHRGPRLRCWKNRRQEAL